MKRFGYIIRRAKFHSNRLRGLINFRSGAVFVRRGLRLEGGRYVVVGNRVGIGQNVWIAAIERYLNEEFRPKICIGDNVSLGDFTHIACIDRVTISDGALIGSRVHITDHHHGKYSGTDGHSRPDSAPIDRGLWSKGPVQIDRNVWIGDGAVILPGVRVGEGSIIGANSVVNRDVPGYCIAAGAPARIVKRYTDGSWITVD